jgi:hypothetical protein
LRLNYTDLKHRVLAQDAHGAVKAEETAAANLGERYFESLDIGSGDFSGILCQSFSRQESLKAKKARIS